MNWETGKLEPISAAGLLPVGAVVTYEDRANPLKRYVVTGADIRQDATGQACICEDGHGAHVSRSACEGPGGWEATGEVLPAEQVAAFVTAAAAEGARLKTERETTEAASHADRTKRRAAALANHPHLEPVAAGQYASAAHGAKNIRHELKRAFPGIKFSVRSETFSGGDSIDISWDLGPTSKEVEAITGKYQEGHFNGMEDIYESDRNNIWPDLFGGAKYVHTRRSEGQSLNLVAAAFCDLQHITKPADGKTWWNIYTGDDRAGGHDVGNIARRLLFAQSYPPGAIITGLEKTDCKSGQWEDFFRVTFITTEPAAERAAVAEFNSTDKPAVTFNAEKMGIEIRFPAKPAEAVLSMLKRHGWRWTRFGGCWYQRASAEAVNAAAQVANLADEARAALLARIDSAHHQAGARGMEDACGING